MYKQVKSINSNPKVNSSTGMDHGVSSCSHTGDDPCPIGTPVSLGATVWYEDDQGLLVVNVQWRGRTYVGTLFDSSKQSSISQNRLLKEEKRCANANSGKREIPIDFQSLERKKVKTESAFISDITLEENIIESEIIKSSSGKQKKPKFKGQSDRSFKCDKCDKNYKFASGLHYHNKHGHKNDKQ